MWSSIANLKENLNKIALDVHDDDEELEIYSTSNKENTPVIDRRNSRSSGRSRSPLANGVSSSFNSEVLLPLPCAKFEQTGFLWGFLFCRVFYCVVLGCIALCLLSSMRLYGFCLMQAVAL